LSQLPFNDNREPSERSVIVPSSRQRYLAEISESVRAYHAQTEQQVLIASERQALETSQALLSSPNTELSNLISQRNDSLSSESKHLLNNWDLVKETYQGEFRIDKLSNGKEIKTELTRESLSGTTVQRVSLPKYRDAGELLRWLRNENLPGFFPYTAGVFPFKREGEDPARMFAGEGDPKRTNLRFKKLSEHAPANRLSTAFDSVTLYGFDPATRPDIYGKIGNSGVSVATLDDMKQLLDGFDLCAPSTSVSMTINGPAPTILAMFLNTAIDQQVDRLRR